MSVKCKRWLIYPVEIKVRELDSIILLACYSACRGYGVILGVQRKTNSLLPFLPKGAYLDKCMTKTKTKAIKRISRLGFHYTSIDAEASSYYRRRRYQRCRFSDENLHLADIVCTWGDCDKEVILEAYPHVVDKIKNTGNPRVDLWGSAFRTIYEDKATALKKKFGKYIFIPSNFCVSSNANGKDFLINQERLNNWLETKDDELLLLRNLEHRDTGYRHYINLIPVLSRNFPGNNIIIRPHPTENPAFWKEAAAGFENVHVLFEGSVTPYILGSSCMVHHGCTTAYEAFLFSVPIIAYLPDYDSTQDNVISNDLSSICLNESDLIQKIAQTLSGKYMPPESAKKAASYAFANYNKWDACDRIIDSFDELCSDCFSLSSFRAMMIKLRGAAYDMRVMLENALRPFLFRTKLNSALMLSAQYKSQKWPSSSTSEIMEIISRYAAVNKRFSSLKCRKLSKDIYSIEKQ